MSQICSFITLRNLQLPTSPLIVPPSSILFPIHPSLSPSPISFPPIFANPSQFSKSPTNNLPISHFCSRIPPHFTNPPTLIKNCLDANKPQTPYDKSTTT